MYAHSLAFLEREEAVYIGWETSGNDETVFTGSTYEYGRMTFSWNKIRYNSFILR